MVETTFEAAIRHLKSGDVSAAMIGRGLDLIRAEIFTRNLDRCQVTGSHIERDFGQIYGLDVTTYELSMPRAFGGFDKGEGLSRIEVSVVDFPADSDLRVLVLSSPWQTPVRYPDTRRIVDVYPEIIASFAGPTFKSALPNNGFYSKERPDASVPFAETRPVGQRRGAIAIETGGAVRLLNDSEKWQAVRTILRALK